MKGLGCASPISAEELADYWIEAITPSREEEVEEHLLGCDDCGARLREVAGLAEGVRHVARRGLVRVIVSENFLRCASDKGLRVRQYSPPEGGRVDCTVTADDDLLIGRLAADLTEAAQVDLQFCDAAGTELARLRDVPANPGHREVIVSEPMEQARALPEIQLLVKLIAVEETGERVVGKYTFNHKPG